MNILSPEQDRIYRAYRQTLKSIPRTVSTRAGARKQRAREIVNERCMKGVW